MCLALAQMGTFFLLFGVTHVTRPLLTSFLEGAYGCYL